MGRFPSILSVFSSRFSVNTNKLIYVPLPVQLHQARPYATGNCFEREPVLLLPDAVRFPTTVGVLVWC